MGRERARSINLCLGSELSFSHTPLKILLALPWGVRGGGAEAPIIRTPISHFIGGLESVEILGVQGKMAEIICNMEENLVIQFNMRLCKTVPRCES